MQYAPPSCVPAMPNTIWNGKNNHAYKRVKCKFTFGMKRSEAQIRKTVEKERDVGFWMREMLRFMLHRDYPI
jgi:hypothetical protein